MKKRIIYSILLLCAGFNLQAQSVLGKWKTVNEETGQSTSIIEIFKVGEELHGRVVRIIKEEDRDRVCTECEGELKNKPIEGMVVMTGLENDGDEYSGGVVTDPKTGKVYRCKIWLDEDNPKKLNVRGYISFFYRTQTWLRAE
ncbi:uncharacterized protein DUF2147 [Gillisia mitskevichiae]|uniref:Uncharacterized protein DUF2147 n=1 Tax=Gillisia mitskevichiae TaxID=270921 RepID=A0A495NZV5_9FLAO|nr:DUF2147 domain-containing protein [Gillisia mitskevichiae]RKS42688.1 uncharacterized protein DUF2147 [Gillisia mitskevichiae]